MSCLLTHTCSLSPALHSFVPTPTCIHTQAHILKFTLRLHTHLYPRLPMPTLTLTGSTLTHAHAHSHVFHTYQSISTLIHVHSHKLHTYQSMPTLILTHVHSHKFHTHTCPCSLSQTLCSSVPAHCLTYSNICSIIYCHVLASLRPPHSHNLSPQGDHHCSDVPTPQLIMDLPTCSPSLCPLLLPLKQAEHHVDYTAQPQTATFLPPQCLLSALPLSVFVPAE